MLRTALLTTLLLTSTALLANQHGQDDGASSHTLPIEAATPWTRATPPGAGAGGGFVTLTNRSSTDDRLVGATSPLTERVELHTMEMDGDVMRMSHLPDGIELPAGDTVTLAPGGLHLMFMELGSPIVEGEPVPVTLEFQNAESIHVELEVLAPGASPEGAEHAHSHAEQSGHMHH
ncbi:copper chaperone PCu(A)C [Halomonas sp. 7T]|uniref:copper chaperone PCu(A)C n=1 Tax=Halomonas sp. 7T TaxID=2893469 RepID=UPI0021DA4B68|nr:copper chaperone PCu(A)C [Halomonas sp. 7T]UXZ54180.1 copper chaperone PCu(A)C [Halomonas sp. 7T]